MPTVFPGDFKGLKLLAYGDAPYQFGPWDNAPIVVLSRKLLFWTTPKVACTVFKKLFRRMEGYADWDVENNELPHNPYKNGLNYLYHFKPAEADAMLTDPSWTRAIFVREPRERLLSAYLDKVVGNHSYYVRKHCCSIPSMAPVLDCNLFRTNAPPSIQLKNPAVSFAEFLTKVYKDCMDPHWRPQAKRMPQKYWDKAINFVGHLDNDHFHNDAQRLLAQVGAWEEFGDMFNDNLAKHATSAKHNIQHYFTPELEQTVKEIHRVDYSHPLMGFSAADSEI